MLQGGELCTIDTGSGKIKYLGVTAALGPTAQIEWAPQAVDQAADQPGLLAFLATSGGSTAGEGFTRSLALFDFQTRQIHYQIPDGITVNGLAWTPDGHKLAFSVAQVSESLPERVKNSYPGPGIYQLDFPSGSIERVVSSPNGSVDDWPHFTKTGPLTLVFARTLANQEVQVIAREMGSGKEWVLVDGLPAPESVMGQPIWREMLAFGRR
jgi:hypothetical protein